MTDFWLFPILKMEFQVTCFVTMGGIKSNVTTEVRKVQEEAFLRFFVQWQKGRIKCIEGCLMFSCYIADLPSGNVSTAHRISGSLAQGI
jgi:hypothetical protein